MSDENLRELIKAELPALLRRDPELRAWVLQVGTQAFADRTRTEGRIEQILEELRRVREEQSRKWAEQKADSERRWEEQSGKWAEQRDESEKRWQDHRKEFDRVHEEIIANARKVDQSIGALGARWGVQSEAAFRNALAGILEESFGVEVLNFNDFDEDGTVFGKPDQVEIDILIHNGTVIACEIKSSVDRAAMYVFGRKVEFYERRHARQVSRKIVISPMVTERARNVAARLGLEVYSSAMDVLPE